MSKDFLEIWNELPEEVRYAMVVKQRGMATTSVYEEVLATVKKYPEHFPDETLYLSIPDEVHEAYRKETARPTFGVIDFYSGNTTGGLIPPVEDRTYVSKPFTMKDFTDFCDELDANNKKRWEAEKREEDLWNKHYAPYGLKWVKNKHLIV